MTDLAVYQPAQVAVPELHDTDSWVTICSDVIKLANVIHDTEFVPDGLRGSAPAVAAAILAGREMGIGPMTSLQNIHVIKGKPTQSALLMRALVQSRGHKWEDVDVSDVRVVVRGCRYGESKWAEVTFTADQAKKAGIDLGKYPQDKLYARASARLCRRKFADVVAGMPYTPDEVEDGEDAADRAGTVAEVAEAAVSNGHKPEPQPAPRTARRARAANGGQPAPAPAPAKPEPEKPADGPPLPPLPGEEETVAEPDQTDYDTPGTVTRGQLGAIWTVLRQVFGFTDEEKDQARAVAAHVIGRPLESTRQMSKNEAKAILDTLANWQATAKQRGEEPRELLIAYMAAEAGSDG